MAMLTCFSEQGSTPPAALLVLTAALSKPFRQLEKYPGVAQEVEQHLEDDHADRGDTQRSIGFYKSVAVSIIQSARYAPFVHTKT